MRSAVVIEDIERMRRCAGIDDTTLREEIARLRVGDHVKLTFLPAGCSAGGETALVRITSIKGSRFRGKLVKDLARSFPVPLRQGSLVSFTQDQVHSIAKAPPEHLCSP